jgi:hypothetical protein
MDWMQRALELEAQLNLLKKEVEVLSVSNFDMVREFRSKFKKNPDPKSPIIPSSKEIELELRLVDEEYKELVTEVRDIERWSAHPKIVIQNVAKEIADLLVVSYGMGAAFGLGMDAVFAEVYKSNMTKLGADGKPVYRDDGKILKGPNYRPPDLESVLFI